MHRRHQRSRAVRVGKLRNPVPQIEHMAAAVSVAAQYLFHLVVDDFRRGKAAGRSVP